VLSIVRSHPLQPQPYTGMVRIVSGEIAEDLATYMAESEQTNSALALGVSINRDCSVNAAGGYLVQARRGAGTGWAGLRGPLVAVGGWLGRAARAAAAGRRRRCHW
jgi:hypothetical protein